MILVGDCLSLMATLPPDSVDSIVTDPPYGIGFMGKAWDGKDIHARLDKRRSFDSQDPNAFTENGGHKSAAAAAGTYDLSPHGMRAFQEFSAAWAREAFVVMKPGAHLVSFASPRTYHRMVCGIEEAGFEIRDSLLWLFGSGFPKSLNLGKCTCGAGDSPEHLPTCLTNDPRWLAMQGWGTALKPGYEPIVLARKPLTGTVASNVLQHGTGALNIDGCRIETTLNERDWQRATARPNVETTGFAGMPKPAGFNPSELGRWPANVVHDGSEEVVSLFPKEAGAAAPVRARNGDKFRNTFGGFAGNIDEAGSTFQGDSGSAARFFYCAKASSEDRNDGCESLAMRMVGTSHAAAAAAAAERGKDYDNGDGGFNQTRSRQNHHPTVKPTDLMRWLCRLITPPGGMVLDPFMGSGSTGRAASAEGFQFIGIELDPEYAAIAEARIKAVQPGLGF